MANFADEKRTEAEIRNFVRLALADRFNSEATNHGLLSESEWNFRVKEQKGLAEQKILQTLVIGSITLKDHQVIVDSDRLIAVQDIRSVFRFPLSVQLGTVSRTATNPYGLIIEQVVPTGPQKGEGE